MFAAFQEEHYTVVVPFDLGKRFIVSDENARVSHLIAQSVDDFIVKEFEELRAGINEIDFDPEIAKHRRVLDADDTGSIDCDRLGLE